MTTLTASTPPPVIPMTSAKPITHLGRNLAVAALAGTVTFGLYTMMTHLISNDLVPAEQGASYNLTVITPQIIDRETRRTTRTAASILETSAPPPNLPPASTQKGDFTIPTPSYSGAAPTGIDRGNLKPISFATGVVIDRRAQPIRAPMPDYPQSLANRNIEGSCEVTFNVSVTGAPYDVVAVCTHAGFRKSAEKAVKRAEFAPSVINGQRTELKNAVYPIAFNLQ